MAVGGGFGSMSQIDCGGVIQLVMAVACRGGAYRGVRLVRASERASVCACVRPLGLHVCCLSKADMRQIYCHAVRLCKCKWGSWVGGLKGITGTCAFQRSVIDVSNKQFNVKAHYCLQIIH